MYIELKEINLRWWIFYNPKYWIFEDIRKTVNYEDVKHDPVQRACRETHWPWWRCFLYDVGINMRLKNFDDYKDTK